MQPSVYSPSPGSPFTKVNTLSYTMTLAILPTWIRLVQRFRQRLQGIASLPCYGRACRGVGSVLRRGPEAVLSISTVSRLMGIGLVRYHCLDHTVTRCSRSREGNVEGEKCSLRSTVCLMICSLLRADVMRDSAVPDIVGGTEHLQTLRRWKRDHGGRRTFQKSPVRMTSSKLAFRKHQLHTNDFQGQGARPQRDHRRPDLEVLHILSGE